MRILFASESYWPNIDGGALSQRKIATRLASRGHEVGVIAPGDSDRGYVERDKGTKIYRTRSIPLLLYDHYNISLFPKKRVKKAMEDFKPDLVHVHDPYPIARNTLKKAKKHDIQVVGSNHILPENLFLAVSQTRFLYDMFKELGWKFLINFYNRCDYVISPTQTAVDKLLQHGLESPAKPISNGIELDVYTPENDGQELKEELDIPDKPVVLYTGRLSGEKYLEILINAAPHVLEDMEAHFIICGSGREKESLEELVRQKGLEEYFTFPGFIEFDKFPNIYDIADVFAISSEAELQSIVTLEALASGLPVVATDIDALPELVHHGKNGFLFQPRDSKDMGKKIKKILEDESMKKKMGEKSREIAKEHSLEKVIDRFEGLYFELLE